jgi:hypothetical protein
MRSTCKAEAEGKAKALVKENVGNDISYSAKERALYGSLDNARTELDPAPAFE